MTFVYFLLIVVAVSAATYAIHRLVHMVRAYLTFRGKRIVSCPETHHAAAVRVAAGKAALEAVAGKHELELCECSRWPERKNCPQDCLRQIEEAPKACMVRTIINRWYQGQECIYCHKPFGEIQWHDHPPALLDNDQKTLQWNEVPTEKLQEVLGTHRPVCWSCHITETFRRERPERFVDRPATWPRMRLYH
jgi:hypothetical protein